MSDSHSDIAEAIAKNYGAPWEPSRNRLLKLITEALNTVEARARADERERMTHMTGYDLTGKGLK